MSWLNVTHELLAPEIIDLPRVNDRVGFLYLDAVSVRQDETGVIAYSKKGTMRVPCATTLVIFLGPGTSISQAAVLTLSRHGTTIVWTGSRGGGGVFSVARPLSSSSDYAAAQAVAWADETRRRAVARRLFLRRFPDVPLEENTDLNTLRGLEGARVRGVYAAMRKIHGLPNWRRRHAGDDLDPVNIALSVANSLLYGVAGAVIGALGLNPALGFIHSGNARSFALDLADLYKMDTAVPSAFACANVDNPGQQVRRSMRSYLADLRVHADMVRAITDVLELPRKTTDGNDILAEDGYVAGGWNQEST